MTVSTGPGHYRGALSIQDAARGCELAIKNAKNLADEAELLLKHGHVARAAALAILSIEESWKPTILRQLLIAQSDRRRRLWNEYRSHTAKNNAWIFVDLLELGARRFSDFAPIFNSELGHAEAAERIKRNAFYTDRQGDGSWSSPDAVSQDLAGKLIFNAKIHAEPGTFSTASELEIWKRHMEPVYWDADDPTYKKAVRAMLRETESKGLLRSSKSAEKMIEFIEGRYILGEDQTD